jgi:hypothetical protein
MTTNTSPMMSESTTQIGYAKNKQYMTARARKHSVEEDERGRWKTLCTAKPATREYRGWIETVTCIKCLKILEGEK